MRLLSVGIPVIWLMIFSVAADVDFEKKYDYETELNRILDTRTEILNSAYFENRDCTAEHLVFDRSVSLKDSFKK